MNRVELLSPAGSKDAFLSAVASGANAVYFGLESFNARIRAENIRINDLAELTRVAKAKHVRCYLTINTLVFDDEFESLINLVQKAMENGIDAVIVQDLGVLSVLNFVFPDLELHASTQLTTHNKGQCDFLKLFSISQINVSRELSLKELKQINKYLTSLNIKSEVFIHGAFCISWSGQCYFSKALYDEAGNRGRCVQPCRRCYSISHSNFFPCFNLKDNNAFSLALELIECGANSLKIEGRIKSPEYVYAITNAWSKQLERIYTNKEIVLDDENLSKVMNRNFSNGYLLGEISKKQFHNGSKDESIKYIGNVVKYFADKKQLVLSFKDQVIELKKEAEIQIKEKNSDFVCTAIINKKIDKDTYELIITNRLRSKILSGQHVFYREPVIQKEELNRLIDDVKKYEELKINITAYVSGKTGENLKLVVIREDTNKKVEIESSVLLQLSEKQSLSKEVLFDKLNKLGNTEFRLKDVDVSELENLGENLFLPISEINDLRRRAVEKLQTSSIDSKDLEQNTVINDFNQIKIAEFDESKKIESDFAKKEYAFLFSSLEFLKQIQDLTKNLSIKVNFIFELSLNPTEEEITELLEDDRIIPKFQSILLENDFIIAKGILDLLSTKSLERLIYCDNSGLALYAVSLGFKIIAGSLFNITNSYSLKALQEKLNIVGFVPSYDLDVDKALRLNFDESIKLWFPVYYNYELMQSRQCLVSQLSNCNKEKSDSGCMTNCNKEVSFFGQKGESLIARKRPNFYSALYLADTASLLSDKRLYNSVVSVFLCDLRYEQSMPLVIKKMLMNT